MLLLHPALSPQYTTATYHIKTCATAASLHAGQSEALRPKSWFHKKPGHACTPQRPVQSHIKCTWASGLSQCDSSACTWFQDLFETALCHHVRPGAKGSLSGRPKQLSLLRIPIVLSASALHRVSEVFTNRSSMQYSQCQLQPMELPNGYITVLSQDQRCWFSPSWHLWSHLQVKDFPHWSQSKKAIKGDCNLKHSNINENLSETHKKTRGMIPPKENYNFLHKKRP